MTDKQRAKHNTDNAARILTPTSGSSLDTAEPTPDGLGPWLGGRAELKGASNWIALKSHPTCTADGKNAHGTNSHIPAPPITEANQKVTPLLIEESDNVPCGEYTEESLNALEGIKHTERPEAFVPENDDDTTSAS